LQVFHEQTAALLGYYTELAQSGTSKAPKYIKIEGVGPVESIRDQIFSALDA
jgi:adenylate kinase